jgi:hypothetical protein
MQSFIVRTYSTSYKGKELTVNVPSEKWITELATEEKAKQACLWIRKNGILCSIEVLNGFLLEV